MVVAPQERDVGVEELGEHAGGPGEDLLAIPRRGRHEPLRHLAHQLVKPSLVQQRALARRQRGGVAEQTPERLGQGAFPAGPGPSLTGHDEGAEDRAISHFDWLDQNAPGDPETTHENEPIGESPPNWFWTRF